MTRFQRDDMLTAIEFGTLTAGGQRTASPGPLNECVAELNVTQLGDAVR